jgi:signal transduction histidine kinase
MDMESVSSLGDIKEVLHQRGGELSDATLDPLVSELLIRASRPAAVPVDGSFESVEEVALAFVEKLQLPSAAVDKVLRTGRALVEIAETGGRLDAAGVARLRQLVDAAAVQVAARIEAGRTGRRAAWLSFLSHELKNPLNTMLNALWLLRERGADAPQAGRFIELAERAVKKLEERIRELKGLDHHIAGLPPGWEGRLVPKRR